MYLARILIGLLAIGLEVNFCENKSVLLIMCILIVLLMILDKRD